MGVGVGGWGGDTLRSILPGNTCTQLVSTVSTLLLAQQWTMENILAAIQMTGEILQQIWKASPSRKIPTVALQKDWESSRWKAGCDCIHFRWQIEGFCPPQQSCDWVEKVPYCHPMAWGYCRAGPGTTFTYSIRYVHTFTSAASLIYYMYRVAIFFNQWSAWAVGCFQLYSLLFYDYGLTECNSQIFPN